jgi:hypothetical protein
MIPFVKLFNNIFVIAIAIFHGMIPYPTPFLQTLLHTAPA